MMISKNLSMMTMEMSIWNYKMIQTKSNGK
jgi:hypothetical protein